MELYNKDLKYIMRKERNLVLQMERQSQVQWVAVISLHYIHLQNAFVQSTLQYKWVNPDVRFDRFWG